MNYRERIDRMKTAGILSAGQAEQLSNSLSGTPAGPPPAPHRRLPGPWVAAAAAALLLILLFFLTGQQVPVDEIQQVQSELNQPGGTGDMNQYLSGTLAVLLLLVVPLLVIVWIYNGIVAKEEAVFSAWAQVESNYQRRSELIPNLIETVSDYMRFERDTLEGITQTRSAPVESLREAISGLIDAQERSAGMLGEAEESIPEDQQRLDTIAGLQRQLDDRIGRIFAVVEDYPELRSSDQILALQAELEGSENRINVARMRFNEAAEEFNSAIRRLPGSLIASLGGFRRKAYFQADAGAEDAVRVDLD